MLLSFWRATFSTVHRQPSINKISQTLSLTLIWSKFTENKCADNGSARNGKKWVIAEWFHHNFQLNHTCLLIVIKSTIVKWVKIFYENIFYQIYVKNEIDRLRENVKSAKNIFSFKFAINWVNFLNEMDWNSDFPEVPQRKYWSWWQHVSATKIRIFHVDDPY